MAETPHLPRLPQVVEPEEVMSTADMLMHVVFKIIVPALEAAKDVKREVFLERTNPKE